MTLSQEYPIKSKVVSAARFGLADKKSIIIMIFKDKGIIEKYENEIYPNILVVAFGDLEQEVNKYYKPYDSDYNWIAKPREIANAITYQITDKKTLDNGLLVWFPSMDNYSTKTLCHESGHVALEMFAYIEEKLSTEYQEPFCYLLGYIGKCINNTYYKYKEYLEKQKEINNPKE